MSRKVQQELPWENPEEPVGRREKCFWADMWYYLYKPLTDEMMVLDEKGRCVWIGRDTIRNTPHLFDTRRGAREAMLKNKGTVVEKYLYKET